MADNLTTQSATPATIPASTVIATDDAGASGHVQIIKLAQSADGSASPITADADGLLVNLGTNNDVAITAAALPLPTGASTSAKQDTAQTALDAIKTAVETLDNTVAGSELQVDIVSSALPSGASTAAKQPALGTAGTPSTDVISVQGITSMTALKVDGSAVTQPVSLTSTTVTGTVAVTQSGIWDEVGINDSGNSITVDNPQLSVVGTGTEAAALRVTIASDSTGVLSVDDNGASLTVDGTVTANLAAGTNNIGDVDVLTLPAIPTGTNTIGSVKITDGTDTALVDASGNLMVNVAAGGAGDGSILDGVSSSIKATVLDYTNSNPLAVRLTDTSGDYVTAAGSTQYTEGDTDATITGTAALVEGAANALAVLTQPLTDTQLRATAVPVSGTVTANLGTIADVATQTTLAAINTKLVTGTDIGDVTINNASGASAVNIQDGGNTITVDAPVGTPAFVRLSDGAAAITTLPVSLASVPSHAVTNAGTFATQVDGAALTALQLIDNPVLVDDAAFTPATSSVMMAGFQADETATDSVDEGDAGSARMTLDRKQIVTPQPHTAGGLSVANFNTGDTYTALTNSAQAIKASAGQVYGWYIYNPNATAAYVMIYNIAAASVTVGTSTAAMVLCIPATAAANLSGTMGIEFATAISIAAATTGGGNTAPTTALEATIFYK